MMNAAKVATAVAVASVAATIILWPRGWRRLRCVLQRIAGPKFIVYAAHNVADSHLLDEATALVEELLGVAAGDHEESCDGLPCGFVLVHTGSSRQQVVGYVRMSSAPGAISVKRLEKFVRMGMIVQARQRATLAGMPEDVIDAILSGVPSSSVSATTPAAAYLGSLVVAPRFQGLGLGKALARIGVAHVARIGCSEVVGQAATPELVPFYESLGAVAAHRRPRTRRYDMPSVKTGHAANSRELRMELGSLSSSDILGSGIPPYVTFAHE
jgi:ribosomal protein S18 acetylase RimI-like enzyme